MAYIKDTIAAIATPPGKGGIGIVRISGPDASRIGKEISKKETEARVATFVSFYDSCAKQAYRPRIVDSL